MGTFLLLFLFLYFFVLVSSCYEKSFDAGVSVLTFLSCLVWVFNAVTGMVIGLEGGRYRPRFDFLLLSDEYWDWGRIGPFLYQIVLTSLWHKTYRQNIIKPEMQNSLLLFSLMMFQW